MAIVTHVVYGVTVANDRYPRSTTESSALEVLA